MKPMLAVSFLLVGLLAAQRRTWIVDDDGGGAHFTDLPPAIAAAAAGDVIRVRPGDYSGITIQKALTILGGEGVRLAPGRGFIHVSNLPAGQQVVVSGVFVVMPADAGASFTNNQGRILLDRVSIVTNVQVYVTDCRQLELNGCWLAGGTSTVPSISALTVTRSTVLMSATRIEGTGSGYIGPNWGAPALTAYDSRIELAHCQLVGGGGTLLQPSSPGGPGLVAYNSTVRIAGGAESRVQAGRNGSMPMSAIATGGGTLELDPRVTLTPFSSAPALYGSAVVTQAFLPALRVTSAPPGGEVKSELLSQPGDLVVAVASLAADETPFGAFGSLWVDPGAMLVVATGVQGANGYFAWAAPVPNDPIVQLDGLTQQTISGTLASGFRLSNPASYVHR